MKLNNIIFNYCWLFFMGCGQVKDTDMKNQKWLLRLTSAPEIGINFKKSKYLHLTKELHISGITHDLLSKSFRRYDYTKISPPKLVGYDYYFSFDRNMIIRPCGSKDSYYYLCLLTDAAGRVVAKDYFVRDTVND